MRWVLALAAATVATYGLRVGAIWAFGARELPSWVGRSLRHAAIGLMVVLVVANLPAGGFRGWSPATGTGVAVAVVVARRSSRTITTMACAIAAYWLVSTFVGS